MGETIYWWDGSRLHNFLEYPSGRYGDTGACSWRGAQSFFYRRRRLGKRIVCAWSDDLRQWSKNR